MVQSGSILKHKVTIQQLRMRMTLKKVKNLKTRLNLVKAGRDSCIRLHQTTALNHAGLAGQT